MKKFTIYFLLIIWTLMMLIIFTPIKVFIGLGFLAVLGSIMFLIVGNLLF